MTFFNSQNRAKIPFNHKICRLTNAWSTGGTGVLVSSPSFLTLARVLLEVVEKRNLIVADRVHVTAGTSVSAFVDI